MQSALENQLDKLVASVREAGIRIRSRVTKTALVRLPWLDGPNREVWAKLECWQQTGSFKIRGAYNALLQLQPGQSVVAASAGNHGLGVATVAAELGLPCKICVPVNASELKVYRLSNAKAQVVPVGRDLFAAAEYGRMEAKRTGACYVSAYSDWNVTAGQGTCALEILEDSKEKFDTVLIPLGGGGLLAGIGSYMHDACPETRIIAVHPKVFDRQLQFGESLRTQLSKPVLPTVADGLAVQVEADNWVAPLIEKIIDEYVSVDEDLIEASIYALLHNQGLLVEGAGAISVGALLDDLDNQKIEGRVLLFLSGSNISSTQLSRAMSVQVRNERIRRLLGLRAVRVSLEVANNPSHSIASSPTAQATAPIDYSSSNVRSAWLSMSIQIKQELDELEQEIQRHSNYLALHELHFDPHVIQAMQTQLELARQLNGSILSEPEQSSWQLRGRYRLLAQQLALLRCGLQWSSTSQDQSLEVMFFDPSEQQHAGVNYARYGSISLRTFELNLTSALGFDPEWQTLLATSSGQSAYQVIEAFLLRDVLKPGDTIAYAPYTYFEAFEQINSLPSFSHVISPSYKLDDLIQTVESSNAKVLFLDPVANVADMPTIDLNKLANRISNRAWQERWFVIDGTMVSGGINPFNLFDKPSHPRILYYESGSKYLQFGLDLQMAGLCVSNIELTARLFRCRRNTGTIMYPFDVARFPKYNREQFLTRMHLLSKNAQQLVSAIETSGLTRAELRVGFPTTWRELGWQHGGGVITILFNKAGLNNRDRLEEFIELLLQLCKEHRVPITKGVSFGFGVTRVSASSSMAEGSDPFLRFSVGEETADEMLQLCATVVQALKIFLRQTTDTGGTVNYREAQILSTLPAWPQ